MSTRTTFENSAMVRRPLVIAIALGICCAAGSAANAQSFDLSDLNGANGFVINGVDAYDLSGDSVSGAGDVNGDGIDDLIVGAPGANVNTSAGESYVVFGNKAGFGASLDLSALNGTTGFAITGIDANDRSGSSVSGAGDVNGDGIDDIIIGAPNSAPNGNSRAGESYVVFGKMGDFAASLEASALNGTNGFVINGIDASDYSGRSVSGAGDVNGDGIDDVIIGARFADPNGKGSAGQSYVVFGNNGGFAASLELSALNGTNGFVINGVDAYDLSGHSVSDAGDVNGDGIDDVIVGASLASPGGDFRAGESYVVFGKKGGFAASLELSALNGANGFVINGIDPGDYAGRSVSGAGDVNGDGIDDVVIGAYGGETNGNFSAGESYVVFGNNGGFAASLELSSLNSANGFVINGVDREDNSGRSVSGAGDVNGDGIDDVIIGAYGGDPNGNFRAGESYVVLGNNEGFKPNLELSDLNGTNGFVINGVASLDRSGGSVSGAGDVNGDGIDDLIIGARYADPNNNSNSGESYVMFGVEMPFFAEGFCTTPGLITAIPDNKPTGVKDVLVIATSEVVDDLDVGLKIDHTWVGDLSVALTHLDTGTSAVLIDRPGVNGSGFGCGGDNIDATLDDEGTAAAETTCSSSPALGGALTPNSPLSAFDGEALAGQWQLTVSDNASLDTGTLGRWCLSATGARIFADGFEN